MIVLALGRQAGTSNGGLTLLHSDRPKFTTIGQLESNSVQKQIHVNVVGMIQ